MMKNKEQVFMIYDKIDEKVINLNLGNYIITLSPSDSIDLIPLTDYCKNLLMNKKIKTIKQLIRISENRLLSFKDFNRESIEEILTWKNMLKNSEGFINQNNKIEKKIIFFFKEDKYVKNFELKNLGFSNRTMNVLLPNGFKYFSDLFNKTEDDFKSLGNLGAKSLKEIFDCLENYNYEFVEIENMGSISHQELFIANISFYVPLIYKTLVELCNKIEEESDFENYETYCTNMYRDKKISENINKLIIDILLSSKHETLGIDEIRKKLPPDFVKYGLLDYSLKELKRKKKIEIKENLISIKHYSLLEYLELLPNDRNSQILKERFSGKTLEEIGVAYGITRERVRQLCNKVLSKRPILEEDKFIPIFEKYTFTEEQFTKTFETSIHTYVYLFSICSTKSDERIPFEEILGDSDILRKYKKNAKQLVYKDYMKVGNSYVLKRRPQIINYVLKTYCKQQTTFIDFLDLYNRIISFAPEEDQENLSIDSERGYANRIADSNLSLWGPHKTFRYYPLEEYDIKNFYKDLNLSQYNNTEVSTVKFIRDNKQLMKDYDIRDEYELHNLLRKTWDEYGPKGINVDFSRMPHLSLGNASREKQVTELLFQNAPIKNTDLADLYEEEYGVAKSSVLANFFKCIERYYEAGVYVVEEKELSSEEFTFLSEYLRKDFYKLSTVKDKFKQSLKNADCSKLNSYNLKEFGYRLFSSYIIKDKYDSAASFFNYILTKDEIIDEARMDQDLVSLGAYKGAVYNMLEQQILYEFDEGKYINKKRLEKLGITQDVLKQLIYEIENNVDTKQFFTMTSLSNIPTRNIINDIAGFENDALFYDSLLSHVRDKFSSTIVSGRHIFRKGKNQFQIEDVIKDILKEERSMDTYDLQKILKGKYNINITLNRILKAASESDLYFAGDYIYINYETYLEEF